MPSELLVELKKKLHLGQKILLKVRVHPKSRQTPAKGTHKLGDIMSDGTIKINLKSAPEDNKANNELIKILSEFFEVKTEKITIISGKTNRTKLVQIST